MFPHKAFILPPFAFWSWRLFKFGKAITIATLSILIPQWVVTRRFSRLSVTRLFNLFYFMDYYTIIWKVSKSIKGFKNTFVVSLSLLPSGSWFNTRVPVFPFLHNSEQFVIIHIYQISEVFLILLNRMQGLKAISPSGSLFLQMFLLLAC